MIDKELAQSKIDEAMCGLPVSKHVLNEVHKNKSISHIAKSLHLSIKDTISLYRESKLRYLKYHNIYENTKYQTPCLDADLIEHVLSTLTKEHNTAFNLRTYGNGPAKTFKNIAKHLGVPIGKAYWYYHSVKSNYAITYLIRLESTRQLPELIEMDPDIVRHIEKDNELALTIFEKQNKGIAFNDIAKELNTYPSNVRKTWQTLQKDYLLFVSPRWYDGLEKIVIYGLLAAGYNSRETVVRALHEKRISPYESAPGYIQDLNFRRYDDLCKWAGILDPPITHVTQKELSDAVLMLRSRGYTVKRPRIGVGRYNRDPVIPVRKS